MPEQDPQDLDRADLSDLAAAARGDRDAFGRLVVRHQAAVYRLIRAASPDAAAAEDALQETFLAGWRHAGTFAGRATVRAWLLQIARNQAMRLYRRRAGEPREMAAVEDLEALGRAAGWGEPEPGPEATAAANERRALLRAALDRLSPGDREVIVLRDLEGLGGAEAAAVLDIPLATLKTRLHRARLRLLAEMRRAGEAAAGGEDAG